MGFPVFKMKQLSYIFLGFLQICTPLSVQLCTPFYWNSISANMCVTWGGSFKAKLVECYNIKILQ